MHTPRFRAFDKYQGDIYDVLDIDFQAQRVKTNFMGRFHNWVDMTDVILLQFTGMYLKDTPVFETDVLSHNAQRYHVQYDAQRGVYTAVNVENPADTYMLHEVINMDECNVVGNYLKDYECQ